MQKKKEGGDEEADHSACRAVALATAAQAQTTKELLAALLVKWNKPTEPFRIIDNVYYVGTDGLASYLITSPQGTSWSTR